MWPPDQSPSGSILSLIPQWERAPLSGPENQTPVGLTAERRVGSRWPRNGDWHVHMASVEFGHSLWKGDPGTTTVSAVMGFTKCPGPMRSRASGEEAGEPPQAQGNGDQTRYHFGGTREPESARTYHFDTPLFRA